MPKFDKLFLLFLTVYILRLVASMSMGLMPQDAYYHFYSEEMALSYFDHPPMVAYMLRLFTSIFGKSVLTIKLANFTISLFGFYGFYYLSRLFLSKRKSGFTSMWYGSTILLTILSINTTPDVPMIFFWIWSLIILHKAIFENRLIYWILAGILMGLAFDSKYTALFLPFGLFIFLLFSNKYRKLLFSKQLLLSIIFFVITIFPVYWWNVQHDWISFKFQSSSRASSILNFNIAPKLFLGNLGTQLFILIPILFSSIIYIIYKYAKRALKKWAMPDAQQLFLLSFSVPIILFFFSVSMFYWVKLNWIMPGYITAIILIGHLLSKKLLTYQLIISLLLHIALIVQFVFHPIEMNTDDTWIGWESLSQQVTELRQKHPESFIFSNDNYKTSAMLHFYMEEDIYSGNIIGRNGLQFMIRYPNLDHLEGKNAIFIDSQKKISKLNRTNYYSPVVTPYFEEMIELDPISIKDKHGNILRKFSVYECINYKGANFGIPPSSSDPPK